MPEYTRISYSALETRFRPVWSRRAPGDGEAEGEIVPPVPPTLSGGVVIWKHEARREERALTARALRRHLDGILATAEVL